MNNNPKKVHLLNPNGKSITWQYDAAGVKLSKTTDDGTNEATKRYVGGIEYVMNASGDFFVVEAIYHSEGRLTPFEEGDYNEWQAEYTLRDHLGMQE
jgi:YD repeat-containing protein